MRTTPVGHSGEWPTTRPRATGVLYAIAKAPPGLPTVTGPPMIARSTSWGVTARCGVQIAIALTRRLLFSPLTHTPHS